MKDIYVYNNYDPSTGWITDQTTNQAIVFSEVDQGVNYTKITTIQGIKDIIPMIARDNIFQQDILRIIYNTTSWASLTNEEKDYLIEKDVGSNPLEKVTYLTSVKGMSSSEAQEYLQLKWAINYKKNKNSCVQRLNSIKLSLVLAKYLSIEDAEDLQRTVRELMVDYEKGVRGKIHQGDTYGALDFFNSTVGTPYENNGLKEVKNYTMQNGDLNMDNFIIDVLDVLKEGNY